MATAMATATTTATAKTLRLQLKLWLLLRDCQPSSPFVYLPSASASCRTTAHRRLTPPTLVVPRRPLPGLIVLILPPCRHHPYARCILLRCCHCVCNTFLLPMPLIAASSLVCWHVHLTSAGNYASHLPVLLTLLSLFDCCVPPLPMQHSTLGSCPTAHNGTHFSLSRHPALFVVTDMVA